MPDETMPQGIPENTAQETCEHEWENCTRYTMTPDPNWSLMPNAEGKRCDKCKVFVPHKHYIEVRFTS